MSWFTSHEFTNALQEGVCFYSDNGGISNLLDSGEGALHITNAILNDKVSLDTMLTSSTSFESIRFSSAGINSSFTNSGELDSLGGVITQAKGLFVGVGPIDNSVSVPVLVKAGDPSVSPRGGFINIDEFIIGDFYAQTYPNLPLIRSTLANAGSLSPKKTFGSGILGTSSYLHLNRGGHKNKLSDGENRVDRRFGKSVYKDILCLELPVIRLSDIATTGTGAPTDRQFLPSAVASDPVFRRGQSCMQCHAAMDTLSVVTRNLIDTRTNASCENTSLSAIPFIHELPGASDGNALFATKLPHGKLYFRDAKGNLINKAIMGFKGNGAIPGIGKAISETEQFYTCTAKRYFNFFTGIDIDVSDPNGKTFSVKEQQYRNQVIAWGAQLKLEHDSLKGANSGHNTPIKNLIKKIISDPIYLTGGE